MRRSRCPRSPRKPALGEPGLCDTLTSHGSERSLPGSVRNRPGASLPQCRPRGVWQQMAALWPPAHHWPQRKEGPPCSLPCGLQGGAGLGSDGSFSQSHCCSGACLGDGAVVTTTVETALEEFEAVPCWRWDAGTVWMRTCSQRECLVSSLQTGSPVGHRQQRQGEKPVWPAVRPGSPVWPGPAAGAAAAAGQ